MQLPFDRLVQAVDQWASTNSGVEICGQIGEGLYLPSNFRWSRFVSPAELSVLATKAELIVSHAGMGSIFTAMQFGKPIVILPRRSSLREHRNDHQLATARCFADCAGITVALETAEIPKLLSRREGLVGASERRPFASQQLLSSLNEWISRG